MESEKRAEKIQCSAEKIREEIRIVGAIGEILQLFEGMGGPVKLEPDCLGVIGKLIVYRMAGVSETLGGLEKLVAGDLGNEV
jgi:hypothetical protein